jgi:hypothetical protein
MGNIACRSTAGAIYKSFPPDSWMPEKAAVTTFLSDNQGENNSYTVHGG